MTRKTVKRKKLLSPGEPRPWRVKNPRGRGRGVIVCDHASRKVPRALAKTFGVSRADMQRHIAWDIGAEDISVHLAKKLDMPAVLASYSRLVVDLNRNPAHRESVPPVSDHVPVPANQKLSAAARKQRIDEIFWPYQDAIAKAVNGFTGRGEVPVLIFVHSFTPEMNGKKRPWHISIMWKKEEKIARRIIRALKKDFPQYKVGANVPYTLKDDRFAGSTASRHAEDRGLPYIFVEFRQDLVDTPAKAMRWANIFLKAIGPVLEDKATYRRKI